MTAEFNSRLIAMVAKNPMIYDNLHPEYKSMAKTNMIWRDISEQLGVSVGICQTRWRTLRSAYGKKHRKVLRDSNSTELESWRYYKQMEFLEEYITHKSPESSTPLSRNKRSAPPVVENITEYSIKENFDDSVDCSEVNDAVATIAQTHSPNKIQRKVFQDEQAEFLQLMQDNRKQLEDIMQERQLDRFDHFGNFIAAHLKTKPAEIADFYIKEITNLVLSDINIEISMRTANQ